MTEKKENLYFHIYLAIFLYTALPRVQMSVLSPVLNTLFEIKSSAVPYVVLLMLVITVQKIHFNKFKKLNLNNMIILAYTLYLLSHSLLFILLAFV